MNCLYTVNVGNFLTNYSRRSFLQACDRWGCDYAELHHMTVPNYPSCTKLTGSKLLFGYDFLLYCDADTVISGHTPNPFETCQQSDTLYAVSDYQPMNQTDAWRDGPYLEAMSYCLSQHPKYTAPPPEKFFNAGVFLFKNASSMLGLFASVIGALPSTAHKLQEQATLNLVAFNTPWLTVSLLPETWNHMVPLGAPMIDEFYINHFGGGAHEDLMERDKRLT